MKGVCICGGEGYTGPLYFLLNVAVNLKLLWKGMSILKNYVYNLIYTLTPTKGWNNSPSLESGPILMTHSNEPGEYDINNTIGLSGKVTKRIASAWLSFSLESLALHESSCHAVKTLTQAECGLTCVRRHQGRPTDSQHQLPSHVNETLGTGSPALVEHPHHCGTTTSRVTQSQNPWFSCF